MAREQGHPNLVQRHHAESIGLGALLGKSAGDHHDRSRHIQLAPFEVHIGPAECAQFATAETRQGGQHEEGASLGSLSSAASMTDRTASTDGALTRRCGHAGRLGLVGDVLTDPLPSDPLMERRRDDGVVVADCLR